MMIITIASFFSGFTGAHHVNPYVVQILNTYQTPMSPNNVTVGYHLIQKKVFWEMMLLLLFFYHTLLGVIRAHSTCWDNLLHSDRQVYIQTSVIFDYYCNCNDPEYLARYNIIVLHQLNFEFVYAFPH